MVFGTLYRKIHDKMKAPRRNCDSPISTSSSNFPHLLAPLIAFISGVTAVVTLRFPDLPTLQIVALAILVYLLYRRRPTPTLIISTALVWGGIGAWMTLSPIPYHLNLIHEIENQQVVLEGQVLRVEKQPQRWRMDMLVNSIRQADHKADARGMKVRIHVASGNPGIYPGDHIYLRSRLRKPRPFGTPGEFNYTRYLLQRDIIASGFIDDGDTIARMAPKHPISISARIARWRQRTGADIAALLPPDSAAYVLSLALGEKTRLSPEQRQTLAFTGLSHLFSISGLHLGMIAACVYALIQWLYRRSTYLLLWQPVQKATPLLCLPFVILYLLLSGSALPTLRATVMLGIAALLALLNYRTRPSAILILVAALILIADPLALQSASFQLSFAGVGGLLLVLPVWHRRLHPGWKRALLLLFMTSYTACLATAPFALWHFHTLAPAGLLNNILAVPLVSFIVLPLTLSATALFSVAPELGLPPLELSATLITQILEWGKALATGPLTGRYIYLSPWGFTAFSLACASLVLWAARRRRSGVAGLGAALILFLIGMYPQPDSGKLRLSALSIGQADAFLIQTPEDRNYLVDGGGLYSDSFDTGAQLIAPALQRLGVSHLDAVILTHDHPDHSKGLHHILRYFPTTVFLSGIQRRNLNPDLRQVLHHPAAPPVVKLPEGLVQLDEYIYLHTPKQSNPEVNERSIGVFGGYGMEGFLLTGDLETDGMAQLVKMESPSPVTLFKLPHHGSRNSLPLRWLKTWDISHTVVSCGHYNHFGFPNTYICDLLNKADIPLWRTDIHGTVQFSTSGKGWEVKSSKIARTNP
ncbi:MAG: DNA internalization-related competence protein ComEC/Rec2 [Desulfuromonadaceae bacterium]